MGVQYTQKRWQNEPSTATPLNADGMNDLESRISAAFGRVPTDPAVGGASGLGVDRAAVVDLFTALDMREARPLAVYGVGDSTLVPSGAWGEAAWKAIMAALYPERQAGVRRWNAGTGKLDAFVQWQAGTGTGGGTTTREKVTVFQDTFSGVASELVGTTPTGPNGGPYGTSTAATGQYERAFTASPFVQPIAGRTADIAKSVFGLFAASDATAESEFTTTLRLSTNNAAAQTTRIFPLRKTNFDGTRIEVVASSAGTSVTVFARSANTTRTMGQVTGTPIPLNTVNNFVTIKHVLTADATGGTGTLAVTINSVTATFPVTAAEMTAWASCDRWEFASTDPTFRLATTTASSYKTTTSAGTGGLPPLTFYNLGASGMDIQYQQDRISAMMPVRPDLVMGNHGMNYEAETGGTYLPKLAAYESAVRAAFDDAVGFWYVSPNVRIAATGVPADRVPALQARVIALREWAARRGSPYSGIYERFIQRPDGGAGLLSDDKHPTAAGYALGAAVVQADLTAQSERVPA
jgi:hypothetical protein